MSSMEYALSPPSEASFLRRHSTVPRGVTNNSRLVAFYSAWRILTIFAFLRASTNDL
jgi:hypothetical protein